MKIVKETLYEFTKNNKPLDTLGLGNITRKDFKDKKDFGDWFYSVLPTILGTEIPKDFFRKTLSGWDVKYEYWRIINNFMLSKGLTDWYDSEDSYPYLRQLILNNRSSNYQF